MDKLRAMQLFVRVVETGALSRAADSLQLPKATATTLIQRLEADLGVRLLERTTRRVTVTADGRAYYERCVALLGELQDTEDNLRRRHTSPRGRLRVDVPTLMARLVIVPALPGFFARYPDIELALASSDQQANLAEEGIDCAVWSGALEDSAWVARRVGHLYFATCAAPSYLAARGRPVHPDDLARHRCINRFRPRSGRTEDWVYSKNGSRVVASLPGQVALEDENSYLAAVEAGLGVGRIPAFVLKEAMERGSLDMVLGDWLPDPAPIHVVYPRSHHLSGKLRVFVDWIADLLANHDGIQLRSTVTARPEPRSGSGRVTG
jgi:LysR family transcriptional regulator, regulator for bpeEF and oprC